MVQGIEIGSIVVEIVVKNQKKEDYIGRGPTCAKNEEPFFGEQTCFKWL